MTTLCSSLGKFSSLYPALAPLRVFGEGNGRKRNLPVLADCFGTSGHFVIEGSPQCTFESFLTKEVVIFSFY